MNENAVLTGCPLLLQLWAYKRFAVGRPIIDHNPYELDFYDEFEDDRPTMGTLVRPSGTYVNVICGRLF